MTRLHDLVKERRAKAPYNKLSEGDVQDTLDVVCAPPEPTYESVQEAKNNPSDAQDEDEAPSDWIKRLDIRMDHDSAGKTYLSLKEPGGQAKYSTESATIAKSCQNLIQVH
jgi:hypothetical protein